MRRTLALGLTLCGFTFATPAFGQAGGAANFRETFIQLDANGDTVLERDEIPEAGRAAFDRLLKRGDTNKNGKLEVEELRALGQKAAVLNDPSMAANRFKNMDKDGDGKVTRVEFLGVAENYDKIDTNKDGFLSKEELTEWMAMQFANTQNAVQGKVKGKAKAKAKIGEKIKTDKDAEKAKPEMKKDEPTEKPGDDSTADPKNRFKLLDKDGDGKISKSEFPRAKLFERLDANNDGFLSADELAKFMK